MFSFGVQACLSAANLVISADCTVKFSSTYEGCSNTVGKGFITDLAKAVAIFKVDDFNCLDSNGAAAACEGDMNDNTTDAWASKALKSNAMVIQYDKTAKMMSFQV